MDTHNEKPAAMTGLVERQLERIHAVAEKMAVALAKIMPIRVHDGADYAEVYFADGVTHSTQAMTMNPEHWRDIDAALTAYKEMTDGE